MLSITEACRERLDNQEMVLDLQIIQIQLAGTLWGMYGGRVLFAQMIVRCTGRKAWVCIHHVYVIIAMQ